MDPKCCVRGPEGGCECAERDKVAKERIEAAGVTWAAINRMVFAEVGDLAERLGIRPQEVVGYWMTGRSSDPNVRQAEAAGREFDRRCRLRVEGPGDEEVEMSRLEFLAAHPSLDGSVDPNKNVRHLVRRGMSAVYDGLLVTRLA